jgi:hypothetical protein
MKTSRSNLRRMVIREMYGTSLSQIFEQAAPADPAADPAAAAATPPADPATPPTDPTAAPATPPATATPPAAGAAPAADPLAGLPPIPGAAPTPAPGVTPTPAPGAAAAGDAAKKKATTPPDPEKEPLKAQLNKALIKATKSGDTSIAVESLRRRSLRFLFEADESASKIDIEVYAGEVARLIQNYTSLVDVKKNVIDQAMEYLKSQFPNEAEGLGKQMTDLLRKQYHISLEKSEPPKDSYAIGATGGGGGGAA